VGCQQRFFGLASGFAPRRVHDVDHQAQGQRTVESKRDDRTQQGALRTECLSHGHHQHHIKPPDHDQVHFFLLKFKKDCNFGDNEKTDTVGRWLNKAVKN